jgi:hypothetical protein
MYPLFKKIWRTGKISMEARLDNKNTWERRCNKTQKLENLKLERHYSTFSPK